MEKKRRYGKGDAKRFLAFAMAMILVWTTVDMPAIAANSQESSCGHHTEHTAECGYAADRSGSGI